MRVLLLALTIIAMGGTAHGGAWAREKGQVFIASAANLWVSDMTDTGLYYDPTLYVEYGLTDRITIGADYYSTARDTLHTGLIFAQFPLGDTTGSDRFAAHIALGARTDFVLELDYLQRGGLSWGRGLEKGWLALDLSATYSRNDEVYRPKADFTWGHNLTDNWTAMFQLQSGETMEDERFVKISPAIIYGVNDNLRISVAAIKPVKGDAQSSIRLSLWQSF